MLAILLPAIYAAALSAAPLQQQPAGSRPGQPQADTARPPVPSPGYWPSGDDTLRTVSDRASPDIVYYRDLFDVRFVDSANGATVRGFLSRNAAVIIGGSTWLGHYTVRVPDPGPGWQAFDALVRRLNAETGVEYAAPITHRSGGISVGGPESEPLLPRPDRAVPPDTGRPPLPDTRRYSYPEDTAWSVRSPGDTALVYYRTVIGLLFDDSTSGVTVRRLLRKYRASIIGGLHNFVAYIVRVPDPGPTYTAVDSFINKLSSEPGVRYAFGTAIRDAVRRQARIDTARPPVPPSFRLPVDTNPGTGPHTAWPELSEYPFLDATRLVHRVGDTTLIYFRTDIALVFKAQVSDSERRAFFARNSITVIGQHRGQFFVRMPDPGPDLGTFYAAIDRLNNQPEVYVAVAIPFTPSPRERFSHSPADGPPQSRSD